MVACNGLEIIDAGLTMLAQERLQAHEECKTWAEELTITCLQADHFEASLLSEVWCGELTDCDIGGQAVLRVHTAFGSFQLSAMFFPETMDLALSAKESKYLRMMFCCFAPWHMAGLLEERPKFAWRPKPFFEHDATNERTTRMI